jgi:serine/threonine protein phosphatase 1
VYIVGDVHGCIDELRALLRQLQPTPEDLVLFTGDLIRKGPASTAVLDLIRRRDNFRSVRGNNEQKVIDDGVATALPSWARLYIETLSLTIGFADALIVHGGVDPREPIHDQPPETLLALRSVTPGNGYDGPFWFDRYRGPPASSSATRSSRTRSSDAHGWTRHRLRLRRRALSLRFP